MSQNPTPPAQNTTMQDLQRRSPKHSAFLEKLDFVLDLVEQNAHARTLQREKALLLGQILTKNDQERKEILQIVQEIPQVDQKKTFLQELIEALEKPQTQPDLGLKR